MKMLQDMTYLNDQNEARFRRILRRCIVVYFALAAFVTLVPFPHTERPDYRTLSNRVAKLMVKENIPPPPVTPETKKAGEEPAAEKPTAKEASPEAKTEAANRRREVVMRSGLVGSLTQGETARQLSALIEDRQLTQALSSVDLITAPDSKRGRPSIRNASPTKTNLADQKIARGGTLKEGERVALEKGSEVALAPLRGGSGGGGGSPGGRGDGNGIGIRLKGGGSGSGGSINYDAIARVVEQYKGGLIYLYNKELRANPTLKGTITVEFSIDANGKVIETRIVTSTMDYAPLEQALAGRIKMWKFPHLYDGVVVVTYPFVFFPV